MQTLETRDFSKHLKRLTRSDAKAYAVHKQVVKATVLWSEGQEPQIKPTHHGESRVPNIIKYALAGFYRLVAYENAGKRILLTVGTHDDVDAWLDSNRGRDFSINSVSRQISFTIADSSSASTEAITKDLESVPASRGPILTKLPPSVLASLDLPEATLRLLNGYATFEDVDDGRVWDLLNELPFASDEQRQVVIQVIALLAKGQERNAFERVELYCGNATTASASPDAFVDAIESGDNSDVLVNLSQLSPEEISHIVSATGFTDWMLFLHPDQKKLVERQFKGPARLAGVSGSGKTSVLVHRAHFLAKQYPQERILVLSLNGALCELLRHLFAALCPSTTRSQITVKTIYEYCYSAVKTIDPSRLIDKLDPKSGEDLVKCWRDFLEKPHALDSVKPVILALEGRDDYVNGAEYVLDELIWIRSGFGREDRATYLVAERTGRGIRFPKPDDASESRSQPLRSGVLPPDTRQRMLNVLEDYEEYMADGGLLDDDGVSLEAFSLRDRIAEHDTLRARCVLVDEEQDCSTVELAVIGKISTGAENGLFLTGDAVQKVFPKQHDLSRANIDIVGRSAILRRNYRNTKQILEAAFTIIDSFRHLSPVPQKDILQPEFAFRDGQKPHLFECSSFKEQMDLVVWYISQYVEKDLESVCITSASEDSLSIMAKTCEGHGWDIFRITDQTRRSGQLGKGIKLALLQDVKGYEFANVFLIDLMDSHVLPTGLPFDERWRIAFQLYVAMTRARDELIMSFVFNRSIILAPLQNTVTESNAADFLK